MILPKLIAATSHTQKLINSSLQALHSLKNPLDADATHNADEPSRARSDKKNQKIWSGPKFFEPQAKEGFTH